MATTILKHLVLCFPPPPLNPPLTSWESPGKVYRASLRRIYRVNEVTPVGIKTRKRFVVNGRVCENAFQGRFKKQGPPDAKKKKQPLSPGQR